MAEEITFTTKYRRFRTYNDKQGIQFEGGIYKTSNPKEIAILEKIRHVSKVEKPSKPQDNPPKGTK